MCGNQTRIFTTGIVDKGGLVLSFQNVVTPDAERVKSTHVKRTVYFVQTTATKQRLISKD